MTEPIHCVCVPEWTWCGIHLPSRSNPFYEHQTCKECERARLAQEVPEEVKTAYIEYFRHTVSAMKSAQWN